MLEIYKVSITHPIHSAIGAFTSRNAIMQKAIVHSRIDPALVGDICVGTVLTPDAMYPARSAALAAGFPESVPVQVINRFCSSGLMAVTTIANQIRSGQIEIGLAVGVESMSEK
jgi:acetyl-CoA acyltransferase 1